MPRARSKGPNMKNPISATLSGLLDRSRSARNVVPLRNEERADGQVALVTGANRGLGKAIAVQLAQRGAQVIMACRSGIPGAGEAVKRESGSNQVSMRELELADFHSIVQLCEGLAGDGVKLDLLVLNAGVVPRAARPTEQGFELMFGVNYLANVLLVERLLAKEVLRPSRHAPPRIVFVSSESHREAGPIDLERLGRFEPYGAMAGMQVYGYSKLLLSTYAAELSRRLGPSACVHGCCPGAVNTDIAREAPAWIKPILGPVMQRFFRDPDSAAEPIMTLCCARTFGQKTGAYLHVMQEKPPATESLDPHTSATLFRESEALIVRALGQSMRGTP